MCNCPQHVLGPVLHEAIEEAGVGEVRFRHELVSLEQDADGVTAVVRDRDVERDVTVRAQYVVGADGGRSRVVELTGLPLDGEHGLAQAANVWFEADLTPVLRASSGRPVLERVAGQGLLGRGGDVHLRPAVDRVGDALHVRPVARDGRSRRTPRRCAPGSTRSSATRPSTSTSRSLSFWTINHVLAERYTDGRILCMGDAVHRHPPANGLGLNTSMADGFNLAWKLAYVLDGRADPSLLDTYDAERRPVGRVTVDRAMKSVVEMAAIPAALGFEPDQDEADGWASLERLWQPGDGGRRGPGGVPRRDRADELPVQRPRRGAGLHLPRGRRRARRDGPSRRTRATRSSSTGRRRRPARGCRTRGSTTARGVCRRSTWPAAGGSRC